MTKLNKKLSISISIVVVVVYIMSITINSMFIHRYYLHEKRNVLDNTADEIKHKDINKLKSDIDSIEEKNNTAIVYIELNKNYKDKGNIDKINQDLLSEFWKKGLSLNKFWIEGNSLKDIDNKSINKIYNQGKTKYSLLVKFMKKDNYLFAISIPIEHSEETIGIVNKFNIIMGIFSVIIITILTFILSNRVIKPIEKLKLLSKDISELNFRTEDIKTNDEIEELAYSINIMSVKLEKAHNELNKRNENLKSFISDASHEMKTPIALIKAYAIGMKDGLDDGTYIDTIIEQAENMTNIINVLLYWTKYEKREVNLCRVDLKERLYKSLKNYELLIDRGGISVKCSIDDKELIMSSDEDSIDMVFNNLISNAIKYTSNNEIEISLFKENDRIILSIKNGIDYDIEDDIENIWKPFYVLDKSRSKELSGTGLGLTIVRTILEENNFRYRVEICDGIIEFYIIFIKST
ncbi:MULTISPECIES: HAMP domain-containing sensor histidine kinase [unclassified Clostridioides]|uniref:sensor histidine kinase n=1 Tax=unclassified Clostridioides TaxID=2635829 RepID=UPI001D10665C|nr:HAMP domain-containing histidine kinase [Clostridioides sp. ES-S-0171-01]MCC0686527.1 HAMP domain-containing histidine kinase [Clostridioides sp. ES-S-0056-01]MCC0713953.1 HAMP domain-containing histidine kinase [Clostridioides sp. ES-S-0077-01]UDN55113.1 HAMP domain-containing histidine kinase [Clostridioides sp. ES-S-0054-01]